MIQLLLKLIIFASEDWIKATPSFFFALTTLSKSQKYFNIAIIAGWLSFLKGVILGWSEEAYRFLMRS
jgi:multisubunit Na+/H+ antiporter MnhF subunit